jgi:hypothetical protein
MIRHHPFGGCGCDHAGLVLGFRFRGDEFPMGHLPPPPQLTTAVQPNREIALIDDVTRGFIKTFDTK